jgi:hypothetical protein
MNKIKDISEKAMLIQVHLATPGNIKTDKQLTTEIIDDKGMGDKSGKWLRQIYPDEALKPFANISNEARGASSQFVKMTLPWLNDGTRILPITNYFECTEMLSKIKNTKFDPAVEEFEQKYPEFEEWAKKVHGPKFRPQDYPGFKHIKHQFQFKVDFFPIPLKEDFRIKLNTEDVERIQQDIDERLVEAINTTKKDIFGRVLKPINHLVNQLKNEEARLRDSLLGNIKEVLGLMPSLNLSGDPDIENLRIEVENSIKGISVESLRDNESLRNQTAERASEIIKKLQGYF